MLFIPLPSRERVKWKKGIKEYFKGLAVKL